MKYPSSIRAEKKRERKLQVVRRMRNKSGQYVGKMRVTMRDKRQNGKTGRFAATQ